MSIDACAELVARGDPDRFAAAMCAQGQGRADLMVLFAFNLEVARAPWVTKEPMIAEMRLQWWRDAVEEIFEDKPVRRHEVVTPLEDLVLRAGLPRAPFDALIDARSKDIYPDPPDGIDALRNYVAATSGGLVELAGRALGATNTDPLQKAGFGFGIGNLLRAVPDLAGRGRKPLPLAGLSQRSLLDAQPDDHACLLMSELAREGQQSIRVAKQSKHSNALTPAFLSGWRSHRFLALAKSDPRALWMADPEPSLRERWRLTRGHLTGRW